MTDESRRVGPGAKPRFGRIPLVALAVLSCALAVLASLALPASAAAQDLPSAFGSPSSDPDFLFERPSVSLSVRGGVFFHRADSDLFDFAEERFTVGRSDFRGPAFGVEGTLWLGSRAEVAVGMDLSRVSVDSEYRDWVEEDGTEDGLPIRQTTRLTEGPILSVGVRYFLRERGRQLGRFAWVPASWNAFVGAGGAVAGYDLEMSGDFVDETDQSIYSTDFESSGGTGQLFVSGGLEMGITTRTSLVLEGRYVWSDAALSRDFLDFDEPLDLSGARVTMGLQLRAF